MISPRSIPGDVDHQGHHAFCSSSQLGERCLVGSNWLLTIPLWGSAAKGHCVTNYKLFVCLLIFVVLLEMLHL